MNRVLMLEISNEVQTRKYTLVIYNNQRYRGINGKRIIENINSFIKYLDSMNFSVPIYILNNKGKTVTEWKINNVDRLVAIYKYIEGNTISWESYTRKHLRSLGKKLAEFHKISTTFTKDLKYISTFAEYFNKDISKLMEYFHKNERTIVNKLNFSLNYSKIEKSILNIKKSLEFINKNQYVHCDFVRGNILFSGKKDKYLYEISGVLDFEKLLYGPKILDISRTLAFLYVDCKYKTPLDVNRYFIYEGYIELGRGKIENNKYLENYMIYFWLRDLWKFLSCNPYESLKKNEHYIRTLKFLKEDKIIYIN